MNTRNPAIKRLTKEWQEIERDQMNNEHYRAYPLEDDIFEWHFVVSGPIDTPYSGGLYHGRMLLPPEYPFKPPSVIFTTPNGRFQTGVKICLSITGYHPEYWQPAWGIRTGLMAIISMMPQKDPSSIGSLSCSDQDIRLFALKSPEYICSYCLCSNTNIWKGNLSSNDKDSSLFIQNDIIEDMQAFNSQNILIIISSISVLIVFIAFIWFLF